MDHPGFQSRRAKPVWPNITTDTLYVKGRPRPWLDMKEKRI